MNPEMLCHLATSSTFFLRQGLNCDPSCLSLLSVRTDCRHVPPCQAVDLLLAVAMTLAWWSFSLPFLLGVTRVKERSLKESIWR